jgi:hypothetical protein
MGADYDFLREYSIRNGRTGIVKRFLKVLSLLFAGFSDDFDGRDG